MNWVQEFCVWWFANVFQPYADFVFVEHLIGVTVVWSIVVTVLLGVFYKPGDPFFYGRFMEKYGFPLLILAAATFCIPVGSILVVMIMPVLLLIALVLGLLLGIFICVQRFREDYEDHLRNELHRLEQMRREDR